MSNLSHGSITRPSTTSSSNSSSHRSHHPRKRHRTTSLHNLRLAPRHLLQLLQTPRHRLLPRTQIPSIPIRNLLPTRPTRRRPPPLPQQPLIKPPHRQSLPILRFYPPTLRVPPFELVRIDSPRDANPRLCNRRIRQIHVPPARLFGEIPPNRELRSYFRETIRRPTPRRFLPFEREQRAEFPLGDLGPDHEAECAAGGGYVAEGLGPHDFARDFWTEERGVLDGG